MTLVTTREKTREQELKLALHSNLYSPASIIFIEMLNYVT